MKQLHLILIVVMGFTLTGCGEHEPSSGPENGGHAHEQEKRKEDENGAKHNGDNNHGGGHEGHQHGSGNEHSGNHETHKGQGRHLALSDEAIREFSIEVREAGPGRVTLKRQFPGEIVFDEGRITHVTPLVPGRAETIMKESGEQVEQGDVLAVLSSRELAGVRSDFLAARARLELAQATFERKRRLSEDGIASEAELQEARQGLRDARVQVKLAQRELETLGMTEQAISAMDLETSGSLARYKLTAPTDGTIIKRHLARGERVDARSGDSPFVIADREQVWAELSIFPQSIDDVRTGQTVMVQADDSQASTSSPITYITPLMHEATRSARARVVLDNPSGQWYPGQFVTGSVTIDRIEAEVVVPRTAIQSMDGQPTVFVRTDDGFEARPVRTGRKAKGRVVIEQGLKAGERYAVANTFTLKAEFGREKLKHAGHSH